MDTSQIQAAFDNALDQAILFHGFADYMRDYEVFIYTTDDPRTGIQPEHLRYRFTHCVRATVTTALSPEIWRRSLDERLADYEQGRDLDGYVWGVKWQALYPGMKLLQDSADAERWSRVLGLPFHEAVIEEQNLSGRVKDQVRPIRRGSSEATQSADFGRTHADGVHRMRWHG